MNHPQRHFVEGKCLELLILAIGVRTIYFYNRSAHSSVFIYSYLYVMNGVCIKRKGAWAS